jgi:hypothetical protein
VQPSAPSEHPYVTSVICSVTHCTSVCGSLGSCTPRLQLVVYTLVTWRVPSQAGALHTVAFSACLLSEESKWEWPRLSDLVRSGHGKVG